MCAFQVIDENVNNSIKITQILFVFERYNRVTTHLESRVITK